jgi:hypothetical protein
LYDTSDFSSGSVVGPDTFAFAAGAALFASTGEFAAFSFDA